jgi:protein-disulfide isomerase
MHNLLFESQNRLGGELFQELAKRLKLASADLLTALETREFLDRVRADFAGGVRSGVNGTPTFFINGQRHDAPFEYADLVAAIEAVLQSK